jgi:hypothetical protein
MLLDTSSWSNAHKVQFLAVLAHEITVCARSTYQVGTTGVSDPEILRAFNEVEHRVTASLRDHLRGTEGIPLPTVLEMLTNFGTKHHRKSDVEYAISRAQQLVFREELKPQPKE